MIKYGFTILILMAIGLNAYPQELSLSDLDPYLKKSVSWRSSTLNRENPLKIYFLGHQNEHPDGAEVIVYLKNKSWDRIGQESDLSIFKFG